MAGFKKSSDTLPATAGEAGVPRKIFKWIAGATAVISLIIGVDQVINLAGAARERRRQGSGSLDQPGQARIDSSRLAALSTLDHSGAAARD